ncbi:MAG: hypothetical protein Q8O18_05385 [Deltaproteobacteria bacterium]|nr:hypothetical protein [Deltaproteobacteria bacterium]
MAGAHRVKKDWPTGLIELAPGKKVNLGPYREWREWPRVLVNVYRWDLERKNQLEAPLDIALYLKIIEELEKMKAE